LQFFTDVRPSRAMEAFCKCEHMFATLRMEGMVKLKGVIPQVERIVQPK
jgi:hypothetical protein